MPFITAPKPRGIDQADNEANAGAHASEERLRQAGRAEAIIKIVMAEEVVVKWEKGWIPCWGVVCSTKYIEKWGNKTKDR